MTVLNDIFNNPYFLVFFYNIFWLLVFLKIYAIIIYQEYKKNLIEEPKERSTYTNGIHTLKF